MQTVKRSLILPYSAVEMYTLANDVERYSEFLPWCSDSQVLDEDPGYITARIGINFKGLRTSFTTRNRLVPGEQIRMNLIEGPFSVLEGNWSFTGLDECACRVDLRVEFTFSGRLIERSITGVFSQICGSLVDAFADRACQVYGERRFA